MSIDNPRVSAPASGRELRAEPNGFGKYQLIVCLGQGGMADVYLAVVAPPPGGSKLQVIKRIRQNLVEEPDFLAMFLDEARLAARLNHPNVVHTEEVGDVNGRYFIAMEYLDGQPLNRIMHRAWRASHSLSPEMLLRIIADALLGLHYAHELTDDSGTPLQVVHRDASPHNIFVTYEGQTKIVDFGIAKAALRSADTRTGVVKGKIAYMAPEQARCDPIDRRADIFAIGILLFELASGTRLWKGLTDIEILERLVNGRVPRPREVRPDVPPELDALCARALAPEPADRYATAAELRADILRYIESTGRPAGTEDVGRVVSEAFHEERAELVAIIERQITALERTGSTGGIVDMYANSLPPPSLSNPLSRPPALSERTPSSSTLAPAPTVQSLDEVAPKRTSGSKRFPIAIAVAASLAGSLVTAALLRGWEPEGTEVASAAGAQEPSWGTRRGPTLELHIQATPPGATIYLDDAPLASNPFTAKFPADGSGHRVRVEAPGFAPQAKVIAFDKDVRLTIALSAQVAKPPEGAAPATTSVGTEPQVDAPETQRR